MIIRSHEFNYTQSLIYLGPVTPTSTVSSLYVRVNHCVFPEWPVNVGWLAVSNGYAVVCCGYD